LDFAVSHQKSNIQGSGSEYDTRAWGQIQTEF